ncbi:MAG: prolipoprotein diacylglyceryl transferase [Bacilli bacterium]|nr:prolipoprotein diacylglyceryl transferase [Bacilli bacterium]
MYPTLFGIIDSYAAMVTLGLIAVFAIVEAYFRIRGLKKRVMYTVEILACIAVAVGFIFAILTQNLYDFIEKGSAYEWTWAMTFYGGLIGGAGAFLGVYFLYYRRKEGPFLTKILVVAPAAITAAHGFGRIGCFLSGCCYGIETDSWLGVLFPGMEHKVYPTNLFEAIFLLLFSGVLVFLAVKLDFKYNFTVYLIGYGIFRFLIEFIRGDHRGGLVPGLTPSQFWSIIMILGGIAYIFLVPLMYKKDEKTC